jgi:hypothetical protein
VTRYALEFTTVSGIADSDYVDRLADVVYELDELIDPILALNDDGSISASFEVEAADLLSATQQVGPRFSEALLAAKPLALANAAAALGSLAISAAADRRTAAKA